MNERKVWASDVLEKEAGTQSPSCVETFAFAVIVYVCRVYVLLAAVCVLCVV